jgi:hypothetical protein
MEEIRKLWTQRSKELKEKISQDRAIEPAMVDKFELHADADAYIAAYDITDDEIIASVKARYLQ